MTFDGFLEKLEMKFVQSAYIDQIKKWKREKYLCGPTVLNQFCLTIWENHEKPVPENLPGTGYN